MAITVIPGPGDKLAAGILAGTRIAALKTRQKQLKAQNDMAQQRLDNEKMELESRERVRVASIEQSEAQTKLLDMQQSVVTQQLEGARITNETKQQEQMIQLAAALAPIDQTPTEEETLQLVELHAPALAEFGIPMESDMSKGVFARLMQSDQERTAQEYKVEEMRANALAERIAVQGRVAGVREETAIDAAGRAEMNILEASLKGTNAQILKFETGLGFLPDDSPMVPKLQKSLEVATKLKKQQEAELAEALTKARKRSQARTQAQGEPPVLNTISEVEAFQGKDFIWGPTGQRRIKN